MTSKEIVDRHFTENIKFYRSLCKSLYKGRYLWEDLLQETYLGMIKSPALNRSTDNTYLLMVGKNVACAIFQKRTYHKKHIDGQDSPLFETAGPYTPLDPVEHPIEPDLRTNDHLEEIKALVIKGLENQDHDMEVFVMAQIESINSMSKRTGITRYCLDKANTRAKNLIKRNLAA